MLIEGNTNYNKKVMQHFLHPKNMGEMKNPDSFGKAGNPVCGDFLKIYLKIKKNKKKENFIKDIKFQTLGCGAAIAVSSMMSELAKGKKLSDAKKISNKKILKELGGLPLVKHHCSLLGAEALIDAIENYENKGRWKTQRFESKVLEIKKMSEDVKKFTFLVPKEFTFKPGQYISIEVEKNSQKIFRPYSIASSPRLKNKIKICVKKIPGGLATEYLFSLKKNQPVKMLGPMGRFNLSDESLEKEIVFISAGTGIAPFVSMITYLIEKGVQNKIILLKSTRSERGRLYDEEFKRLQKKNPNFHFYNILSRPENKKYENQGYVQDFLKKYVPEDFEGEIYICGLKEMINAVEKRLKELGINERQIFYERYN